MGCDRAAALFVRASAVQRARLLAHSLSALVELLLPEGPLLRTSLHLLCSSSTGTVQGKQAQQHHSCMNLCCSANLALSPQYVCVWMLPWPEVEGSGTAAHTQAARQHMKAPRVWFADTSFAGHTHAPSSRANLWRSELLKGGALSALQAAAVLARRLTPLPNAVRCLCVPDPVLAPRRLLLWLPLLCAVSLQGGLRLLPRAPPPSVRCMLLGLEAAVKAVICRDVRACPAARSGMQPSLCLRTISRLEAVACKLWQVISLRA